MKDDFKKDYEPYQTMGPLCGVFDQRAAEQLCHHADALGFDAISAGGVIAWMMDLLDEGQLSKEDLGVTRVPRWKTEWFDPVADSTHNSELGMELLDSIIMRRGVVDLSQGARKWGRQLSRARGKRLLDSFVYVAFGRQGWMVPNQYWAPGVLAPMPIMGKYYMYYGFAFAPPRTLGRLCAERFQKELLLDTAGFLPVPPRLGRRYRGGSLRQHLRHEGPAPCLHGGHRHQDQLPKRVRVLGIGAQHRPRPVLPEADTRRGGRDGSRSSPSGSRASRRTGKRRRSTGGSRCAKAWTKACGSSDRRPPAFGGVAFASSGW